MGPVVVELVLWKRLGVLDRTILWGGPPPSIFKVAETATTLTLVAAEPRYNPRSRRPRERVFDAMTFWNPTHGRVHYLERT